MKTMKHLKEDYIQLDKAIYKPYKVCDIPSNFGNFKYLWVFEVA